MNNLNQKLADDKGLSDITVGLINDLHKGAEHVINNPEKYDNPLLTLENIEYSLQKLWGFPLDKNYHHYSFKLKDCTCPKDDNMLMLGSGMFYKRTDCKYHGINQEILDE